MSWKKRKDNGQAFPVNANSVQAYEPRPTRTWKVLRETYAIKGDNELYLSQAEIDALLNLEEEDFKNRMYAILSTIKEDKEDSELEKEKEKAKEEMEEEVEEISPSSNNLVVNA